MIPEFACAEFHNIPSVKLSEGDFGGVGLWQTPTARMKPDGQFDFVVTHAWPYTRGNVVFQPLPWMEAIIRYTSISNVAYGASTTGESNKDKSADIKFRLAKEGYYMPQVAVGFRDFVGTGLFSSEYVNATKRFGLFDVTLGIAWGNMAGGGVTGDYGNISNPLCALTNSFCSRVQHVGEGGAIDFGQFFGGERSSLFGGVEYQTPFSPLRLKLEYDPNDYQHEAAQRYPLPESSHWNVGAVYRLFKRFDLSLAYERGNTLMAGIDFSTNFNYPGSIPKIDTAPLNLSAPPVVSTEKTSKIPPKKTPLVKQKNVIEPAPQKKIAKKNDIDWSQVVKRLSKEAGFRADAIYVQGNHLILEGQQKRYRNPYMATLRVGSVLYDTTPHKFQTFTIIDHAHDLLFDEISISRKQLRKVDEKRLIPFNQSENSPALSNLEINYYPKFKTLQNPLWKAKSSRWNYYIQPGLVQSIGGPNSFDLYRALLTSGVTYDLKRNLLFTGDLSYDLFDNMGNFNYEPPSSPLPRVRSNIRRYLTSSRFNVNVFQLNYFKQIARNWYGQIYGGYLEQMFAGVGAEVLYRPVGSAFAFSADINQVQQRDFNVGFGLLPYNVTTGNIVWYYQWPIYHILSKVSVGQYLAGDRGVTVDLSRQFHSGIVVGCFVTLTNVSEQQFGEGSFNKGVYIKIPLDVFLTKSTTDTATLGWVPLTRDGGQMLNREYQLYDITHENPRGMFR